MNFTRHKQLLFGSIFSKIRHKSSVNTPFQFCLDSVRQYDYENFLSTLLLKDNVRSCAFVLRAFNVEVSRVQEQVSETNIGLMRYQFWADTLEKIYTKDITNFPAHPVAQELYKVCRNFDVSKRNLSKLVNTRKNNISKKYFNNIDEIEKYAEDTVSPIYYLLLELAGLKNVHCDHAASHLGKAQGLANMLRSVEQSAKQRFVVLPLDLLLKHNLSQEDVLRCVDNQKMKDVVFEVASRANQHLTKARSIQVPSDAKVILLPAVAVDGYLKRLQKNDFDLFNKKVKERDNLLSVSLYWNKLRSKY